MKPGARIEVVAEWSTFFGVRGRVTQVQPFIMVVLDDDPRPIRMGDREVVPVPETPHIGGAE